MRRHDFDALSFIFGLLFAVAGLALLGASAVRDGLSIPWAGPVVAIGLALLIAFAARPQKPSDGDATEDAIEGSPSA